LRYNWEERGAKLYTGRLLQQGSNICFCCDNDTLRKTRVTLLTWKRGGFSPRFVRTNKDKGVRTDMSVKRKFRRWLRFLLRARHGCSRGGRSIPRSERWSIIEIRSAFSNAGIRCSFGRPNSTPFFRYYAPARDIEIPEKLSAVNGARHSRRRWDSPRFECRECRSDLVCG